MRYKRLYSPTHPLAHPSDGKLTMQRKVLYDAIGPGPHFCHWCGEKVEWMRAVRTRAGALIADHLDGNSLNNSPTNLVPSCHRCNCMRGMEKRVLDNETFVVQRGRRQRAERRICPCGESFLFVVADKRPNRGRYCSRSCARKKL